MLLHHAWHNKTINEPWNGRYFTCPFSKIDIELQETFADWAADVSSRITREHIPYGVFYRTRDADGGMLNDANDLTGLSCATFLLELFNAFNLPLLQLESWPQSRSGDYSWLRKIMKMMREYVPESQFFAHFRHRHKLRRYRPEEVAGTASHFAGAPLHFDVVGPAGQAVLSAMKNMAK